MHIAALVRFIETELTEIWRYTIQKGERNERQSEWLKSEWKKNE